MKWMARGERPSVEGFFYWCLAVNQTPSGEPVKLAMGDPWRIYITGSDMHLELTPDVLAMSRFAGPMPEPEGE